MKTPREIIRDLRRDKDMSQIAVAKVLGTSQQHYSKYENGETEIPAKVFATLADFYGVSVDYLFGRPTIGHSFDVMTSKINASTTAGDIVYDMLNLNQVNRNAVVEYVFMQKLKEEHYRQKEISDVQ